MPSMAGLQRQRARVDGEVDVDGLGRRLETAWQDAPAATKCAYVRNLHGFIRDTLAAEMPEAAALALRSQAPSPRSKEAEAALQSMRDTIVASQRARADYSSPRPGTPSTETATVSVTESDDEEGEMHAGSGEALLNDTVTVADLPPPPATPAGQGTVGAAEPAAPPPPPAAAAAAAGAAEPHGMHGLSSQELAEPAPGALCLVTVLHEFQAETTPAGKRQQAELFQLGPSTRLMETLKVGDLIDVEDTCQ
eukprot:SAG22_NODE_6501_length_846_cov_1.270415_1_plen_250_part_01